MREGSGSSGGAGIQGEITRGTGAERRGLNNGERRSRIEGKEKDGGTLRKLQVLVSYT